MTQQEIFRMNLSANVSASGKSQKEIAEAIGVKPTTFNMWMNGKAYPRPDKIELIANYFHLPVVELIDYPSFMKKEYPELAEGGTITEEHLHQMERNVRIGSMLELFMKLSDDNQEAILHILEAMVK